MLGQTPERFVFEAPFEDLTEQEDVLTATYGAKRLEYRAGDIKLEGKPFSLEAFGIPVLIGLLSLLIASYIDKRFIVKTKVTFNLSKQDV